MSYRASARLAAAAAIAAVTFPALAADQALIDAAKKEGSVTWYTTAIVDQFVRPAVAAFEKKYGIHVDYWRASTADLLLRAMTEAQSGHMLADLVDGTTTSVTMRKQDMIEKWLPQVNLPAKYIDPDGYWMANNEYVLTPGYNTDLVPANAVPKTWQDLLDPRWKDKIAWNSTPSSSAGQGFVGLVLMEYGEEKGRAYLAQLGKQNVHAIKAAARQVLDQVISGEFSLALEIFNNHATISKAKGAPVDWIKMEPAMEVVLPMSVTKNSPHPNAGKLLFDFIMSDEGQTIMAKAGELPVAPNVPPLVPDLRPDKGNFRATFVSPEQLLTDVPKWAKVYDDYFR